MGRYSTVPEVEDLNLTGWVITRVLDPDDEFAEKQVLGSDGWFPADSLDAYEAFMWMHRNAAEDALEVYTLGASDGLEAAQRAIGSVFH